jgi:hypothetical protein
VPNKGGCFFLNAKISQLKYVKNNYTGQARVAVMPETCV